MRNAGGVSLAALCVLGWVRAACADAAAAPERPRSPFVIGAPGRLDAAGDRCHPRRYQRADSAVGAYADIEEVQDVTWLRHEVESYARRAVDCAGVEPAWCRREVRRLGPARVIALVSGAHAELVWLSRGNLAVRLGWRRIVVTHTGSMTLETPPEDFADALLAEFPSQLETVELDTGHDVVWAMNEVDRLLHYADQVIAGLPAVVADAHRRHALDFVEGNLGKIAQLRVQYPNQAGGEEVPHDAATEPLVSGTLPLRVAEQLAAVRVWRTGTAAPPWCAPLTLAIGWQP